MNWETIRSVIRHLIYPKDYQSEIVRVKQNERNKPVLSQRIRIGFKDASLIATNPSGF